MSDRPPSRQRTSRWQAVSVAWRLWVVVGATLISINAIWAGTFAARVVEFVVPPLAVVVTMIGVTLHRPDHRLPWFMLTGMIVSKSAGQLALGAVTTTTTISVILFAVTATLAVGATTTLLAGVNWRRNVGGLLDAVILTTAFAPVAGLILIEPLRRVDKVGPVNAVSVIILVGTDMLLVGVLLRFCARRMAGVASIWPLVLGLLAMTSAHAVLASSAGRRDLPAAVVPVLLVAYVSLAGAALHPSMVRLRSITRVISVSPARVLLIGGTAVCAPVLVVLHGSLGDGRINWPVSTLGSIVTCALVVVRMAGLVGTVQRQATMLRSQAGELDQLAHRDALTGLPNRRAWDAELERRLDQAVATGDVVTVAVLDLDHFKHYNDSYGHVEGDRLLRDVGAAWSAQLRSDDFLARYGGEEFGLVLIGATASDAVGAIERLRSSTPDGQTFSAGVTTSTGHDDPLSLTSRADEALYAAKRSGRNRTVVLGADAEPIPASAPAA